MNFEKLQAEAEELQARLDAKTKNPEAERLAKIQAAIEAEEKRLNSKAYKNALKTIEELETKAEELNAQATQAVYDALAVIEKWEETAKKHRAICNEHRIEAKDLYNSEATKRDKLVWMKTKIETWKRLKHLYEDVYPRMAEPGEAKPANQKRGLFGLTEREKMLRERYPKTEDDKHQSMIRKRYPED